MAEDVTSRVSIGMIFHTREIDLEVPGDEKTLVKQIQDTINDEREKVLTLTDDSGKTVILPVDKIAYVDIHPDTGSTIGFN